ncbi:MAG: hypothetical protein KDA68_17100 [Planctomycetaceae bacterium]|nr:hypothetical protein [Planctomycetaceae bacterium]
MLAKCGRTLRILFAAVTLIWQSTFVIADDIKPGSDNAAIHYWVAFSYCSKFAQNRNIQEATVYETDTGFGVPVSEELARVLNGQVEYGLQELHRGSKLSRCDWATDFRADGPFVRPPQGDMAHGLARVSLLRARWRFERKEWNKGIDDVVATFILARQIGRDQYWANLHNGCMIENMCTSTISVYLLEMPESARDYLEKELESLPKFTPMKEAILASDELIEWAIQAAKEADKAGELEKFVSKLIVDDDPDELKKVMNQVGDLDGLIRKIESVRPLVLKLAEATALAPAQYERHFNEHFESEFKQNPLAGILINADAFGCRSEEGAAHCRLEALKTAIDIQRRGKSALADHPDPYGTGPFGYEKSGTGYRLRSEFRYEGKLELEMTYGTSRRSP